MSNQSSTISRDEGGNTTVPNHKIYSYIQRCIVLFSIWLKLMYKQWLDDYFISVSIFFCFWYYEYILFNLHFSLLFHLESGHGAKMLKHRFLQTVRSTKINTKNYWIKVSLFLERRWHRKNFNMNSLLAFFIEHQPLWYTTRSPL